MAKGKLFSTVKAKLVLLSGTFGLTIAIFAINSYSAMNAVKVGGPLYNRITQTMNIRADILPPPQYLIETELTAFQMASDALAKAPDSVLQDYEKKLKQLRKDFEDGQESWAAQLPNDTSRAHAIRVMLLENNRDSGRAYFKTLFGQFLPAVYARNETQINLLLHGSMKRLAEKHRSVIDQLTALTDESSSEDENVAKNFLKSRITTATVFLVGMLSLSALIAVITMRAITKPVAEAIRAVRLLESGNLNARIECYGKDELGMMCESLNKAIESVRSMLRSTVESSENLGKYSTSLSSVASSVTAGVHRQASNLTQTSAQLNEVAGLSQSMAIGGRSGQEAAVESREAAAAGIQVVESAIAGMASISKAAAAINQIVDAVDDIGFNTNLLAVNAQIEAGVAGQHGRGFRVVAEEIRSLSLRTAVAGKTIRKLIQDTQNSISQGTERVQASGEAFSQISTCVQKLKAIMDEIAASCTTQADSLKQLNETVNSIADVVDQNNIGTETINNTARHLATEAQNMHALVSAFKLD